VDFLKSAFNKLLLNFTWWVNRKDRFGKERLRGGLPRPGQTSASSDRRPASHRRPPGAGGRHGVDGLFSQKHLELASELAVYDSTYET